MSEKTAFHITNDEPTAHLLQRAGMRGLQLAWKDPLYVGPVTKESLELRTRNRVKYFSQQGWGEKQSLLSHFQERNLKLKQITEFKKVSLWFDRNMYNQLQLIELLDCLSHYPDISVFLINVSKIIQRENSLNLDKLSVADIKSLYHRETEITANQLSIGLDAWRCFAEPDPRYLLHFKRQDMSTMPYLYDAMKRLQQQYPSTMNGLSRTQRQVMDVVDGYPEIGVQAAFEKVQAMEERPFLSPAMFWMVLKELSRCDAPALEIWKQEDSKQENASASTSKSNLQELFQICHLRITDVGREVLRYHLDWLQVNGINRWIGGVHLQDGNIWRYDPKRSQLVNTFA